MKHITLTTVTAVMFASSAFAGDYIPSAPVAPVESIPGAASFSFSNMDDWFVKPTVDARLRYEHRNEQSLNDAADAVTFRIRPGLQTKSFEGFSAVAEGEFSFALVDDYSTPGQSEPGGSSFEAIADPETTELNQGYLQYAGEGFTAKVGRQRINLDEQQFVGGVAWRNNEQTYDAASLAYKNDSFDIFYAYMNQANRIFGSDAGGPLTSLEGDGHILNAKFSVGGQKVGAYAYLLDFDEQGAWASSNTYGAFTTISTGAGKVYLEAAVQTDAGDIQFRGDYTDYYGHVSYSQKVGEIAGTAGLILHGEDFATPLQTAHKFNGFADAFLGNQIGLFGGWEGLADFYVSGVKAGLPGGIKFVGQLHYFMNDDLSETYGWEADAVLVKKINSNLTALAKFAYFTGEDDYLKPNDIASATVQLDFKF